MMFTGAQQSGQQCVCQWWLCYSEQPSDPLPQYTRGVCCSVSILIHFYFPLHMSQTFCFKPIFEGHFENWDMFVWWSGSRQWRWILSEPTGVDYQSKEKTSSQVVKWWEMSVSVCPWLNAAAPQDTRSGGQSIQIICWSKGNNTTKYSVASKSLIFQISFKKEHKSIDS